MKARTTIATLALLAAKQAVLSSAQQQLASNVAAAGAQTNSKASLMQSDLDDLSLEELLGLRESILEAKLNLTYYIEESDDDDDDDENGDDQDPNDALSDEEHETEAVASEKVEEDSLHTKDEVGEDTKIPTSVTHEASRTENLLALREGLIAEIQQHMHASTAEKAQKENSGIQEDSIDPNLTYDLAEGHNKTLKGSMNNQAAELPKGYENALLALYQNDQAVNAAKANQQLDTNVMYDPLSGEGLVCVNGRCISNKRKFQVHDEKHIGLRGGNRRQRKAPPKKRKKIPRHNGIPMNPYENIAEVSEEDEDSEEEELDLVPFEGQEDLLDESFRDGKVYNYGGQKPQQPQKPQSNDKMHNFNGNVNTNGSIQHPNNNQQDAPKNAPIASQLAQGPSFKPGQPFTFSTGRNMPQGGAQDSQQNQGQSSNEIQYIHPLEVSPKGSEHQEDADEYDPYEKVPRPHRHNPYGEHQTASQQQSHQQPVMSFDTGNPMTGGSPLASSYSKRQKKQKNQETEFPALFCDEGDCTLGQSHTGVACVWNHCVSTHGEEMAAEMCEGENCWDSTDNILCVDDYCHVIEAEFIGFRGVPCAGNVCGYEEGVSICNVDKCTFTSEDGLSFGQGLIDINGVENPCDDDPILCAGHLCACVDPAQHFETDLLGMDSTGTLNCDNGKCQMTHHMDPNEMMIEEQHPIIEVDPYHVDPYGYSQQQGGFEYHNNEADQIFKPNGDVPVTIAFVTLALATALF